MYLKSIEINGFKSFANRIVLKFDHGFTGIVGPNGSGKSNVADAVRWVLGEQSAKQLRSSRMEDVIFAGTELRKPLSYAYVALTLDNSDGSLPVEYEEVIVARKVYRSGESEYLLNGSPARLKDIQSMFFDTGIGKEGYSIIGQGQIDKILSGKPEERRELFDEAAGIVKYKKNKAATEKSLAAERDNLSRVNDIITELERQVGPLREQSAKARQYVDYKADLKTAEVNSFLLESDAINERSSELQEKLKIATGELADTAKAVEQSKSEYDSLESEKSQAEKNIADKKQSINDYRLEKEKASGSIAVFREQINTAKANDENLASRITQIEEQLIARGREKDGFYARKSGFDEKLDEIDERETEAQEKLDETNAQIAEAEEKIETYKSDIVAFANESAEWKAKASRYDAMLENVKLRRSEINQRMLTYKSQQQEQNSILADCETKREEYAGTINQILSDLEKNREITAELNKKSQVNASKLRQAEQEYHRSYSRLETLKNMAERYDGFGGSIKRVMQEKRDSGESGVIGVVADVMEVSGRYELAIETALGGSIQNIVTEDEETAKRMIAVLKRDRAGRATFLPLTSVRRRGEFREKQALSEPGVIGLADTLVSFDSKFADLMAYLLGRTLVVDNIDNAISLSRKYRQSLRIVTLEGESITPGGAMSGGAYKNSSNLLGRKREIDEYEKRMADAKEALEAARRKSGEISSLLEEHRKSDEDMKAQLSEVKVKNSQLDVRKKQANDRLDELVNSIKAVTKETTELEEQVRTINKSKDELFTGAGKQQEEKDAREAAVDALKEKVEELRALAEKQSAAVSDLKLEFQSVEQQSSFLLENIKRISGEEQKLNEEKDELISKTGLAYDEIDRITYEIAKQNDIMKELSEKITGAENELETLQTNYNEMSEKHRDVLTRHQQLTERKADLDNEVYRLTKDSEKQQENLDSLNNYMWSEYELTYFNAADLRDENLTNLPELKKKTSSLRRKIRDLGDVNVSSIEEYRTVSERYEFLTGQRDDIVKSEENLTKIISELDRKMREQFSTEFAKIREMFAQVFRDMFGGGKADLIIDPDADLLTCDIGISAQPPGKKLVNMMQLSGGEKALTAIALLFAIQNLKPSPFCLLDEIEAALDDANVDRFASYIHRLTDHTQFIVITHRRGTMTAADVLYGITMQEKGVSTLVSVDLIEDELEQEDANTVKEG